MEKEIKKIENGLRQLPRDDRDFSHEMVFGSLQKRELPSQDFDVCGPLGIKDQGATDFCTAYATSAVSEDQEGVLLNPEYIFLKSKELSGDPEAWGQDLRTMMKAHCKFGTIEQQFYPYLGRPDTQRSVLVNPKDWDEEGLAGLAYEHRKNSFFKVDGPYDTFDNFRSTLWMHKDEMRSIATGAMWKDSFTKSQGGVIADIEDHEVGSGHAFKIYGQKTINGVIYLKAQLSNGIDIGDHGIFYFPRGVVNREFTFGAFHFSDMPKTMAAYHAENGISVNDGLIARIGKVIKTIINNIF